MKLKNILAALLSLCVYCESVSSQEKVVLTPTEFSQKILSDEKGQVLDVRTRQEFSQNHLKDALQADYNQPAEFEERIKYLDKNKPVYVYCLAGARSAKAADYLVKQGFKQVYDMQGGIRNWMAANQPVEKPGTQNTKPGMSLAEFDSLLSSSSPKLVLVDFGAKWCPPCRKLAPELAGLANEMKNDLALLTLDVEENETLSQEKKVNGLPTLQLYKNGKLVWQQEGYMSKDQIAAQIKQFR